MVARVKKNDTVIILSGKDKGKQGSVLEVVPAKKQVLVKGVAIVTRHVKPKRQGETAGIKKEESYIHLSKVMPVCGSCNKPCRIQAKVIEAGKKVRMCHRCQEVL